MNEKELEEIVEKIIESTELFTMYAISLIRLTNSMRALAKTMGDQAKVISDVENIEKKLIDKINEKIKDKKTREAFFKLIELSRKEPFEMQDFISGLSDIKLDQKISEKETSILYT